MLVVLTGSVYSKQKCQKLLFPDLNICFDGFVFCVLLAVAFYNRLLNDGVFSPTEENISHFRL